MILCYVDEIEKIAREGIEESDSRSKYNIAQNQSFVQKGIGVKYKTIVIWSYLSILAIPLIKPFWANCFNNKLYYFLIKSS